MDSVRSAIYIGGVLGAASLLSALVAAIYVRHAASYATGMDLDRLSNAVKVLAGFGVLCVGVAIILYMFIVQPS